MTKKFYFFQKLRSKIPKAIPKKKSFLNLTPLDEQYILCKRSHTLKSLPIFEGSTCTSNISTAIYKRRIKSKNCQVEVIFVKPENSKSNCIKKCRTCESSKITKNKVKTSSSKISRNKVKTSSSNILLLDKCTSKTDGLKCESRIPQTVEQHKDVNHCLELLVKERNKKVKNFMAKLLVRKKKVTKSLLPIIDETEVQEALGSRNKEAVKDKVSNEQIKQNNKHSELIGDTGFTCLKNSETCKEDEQLEIVGSTLPPTQSKDTLVKIRLIERKTRNKFTVQHIEFVSSLNQLTVSSKVNITEILPFKKKSLICSKCENSERITQLTKKCNSTKQTANSGKKFCVPTSLINLDSSEKSVPNCKCQKVSGKNERKFSSKKRPTMLECDGLPNQIYSRVSNWISSNDFLSIDHVKTDTDIDTVMSNSKNTDLTSVSKIDQYDRVIVEERTDVLKFDEMGCLNTSTEKFSEMMKKKNQKKPVRTLSKFSQYSPFQNAANLKSASAPPTQFSIIVEGEESVCVPLFIYSCNRHVEIDKNARHSIF